jgi:hypothetical protein
MKLCCSLIKERALLILDLLKSLDPVQDAEIENAWLSGAEKNATYLISQEKLNPVRH